MFDRYAGDNKTELPVEAKMYYQPDGRTLCLPSLNIMSFLCAVNTDSAAKLVGGKMWKTTANALRSFVSVDPEFITLTREGKPVVFHGFVNGEDVEGGIRVVQHVARLPKGIPNPKERPVVCLPWELEFTIRLFKNDDVDELLLQQVFRKGGLAIGLGTFRGNYGKFVVESWE